MQKGNDRKAIARSADMGIWVCFCVFFPPIYSGVDEYVVGMLVII